MSSLIWPEFEEYVVLWYADNSGINKRLLMKHIVSEISYAIIMASICGKNNKTRIWIVGK